VDPRAAKYPSWSPYNYALNNPAVLIDPNGDTVNIADAELKKIVDQLVENNANFAAQYDQLQNSETVFNVKYGEVPEKAEGETRTQDGNTIDIVLKNSNSTNNSIESNIGHEFAHGQQVLTKELQFKQETDGKWKAKDHTVPMERKAYDAGAKCMT
jgi:Asp-tRNA(Asn)/Glu-tRNA(Gln) amidotransferase B subunit